MTDHIFVFPKEGCDHDGYDRGCKRCDGCHCVFLYFWQENVLPGDLKMSICIFLYLLLCIYGKKMFYQRKGGVTLEMVVFVQSSFIMGW